MQFGVFAKTFEGRDPLTVLSAAQHAGFAAVQYNMACSGLASMPDALDSSVARAVASAALATGISITAVSGTYNMIHPDVAVRDRGHARLRVLAARCAALGTGFITLCTGTRDAEDQWRDHPDNHSPEAWRDLCISMAEAIRIAEEFDVVLALSPSLPML